MIGISHMEVLVYEDINGIVVHMDPKDYRKYKSIRNMPTKQLYKSDNYTEEELNFLNDIDG